MAKWKNALLLGTLVIPMAAGSIEGVADAALKGSRPNATDVVVHKYVTETLSNTTKASYYFGDGNTNTTGAFGNSDFQKAGTGYGFTAFQIPDSAIKGYETASDKPKISTEDAFTVGGTTYKWSDVLEAKKVTPSDATYQQGNTSTKKSQYTIAVKSSVIDTLTYAGLIAAIDSIDVNATKQVQTTDGTGDASFNDLVNGNWIVMETTSPADVAQDGRAVPMVLHLPMVNPAGAEAGTDYWFDGSGVALQLYAKNYKTKGDLTVVKYDSDDYASKTNAKRMAGAGIQLFQGDAAAVQAALQTGAGKALLKAANTTKSSTDLQALQNFIIENGGTLVDYKVTTGSGNAKAHFTNLTPGQTYHFVELIAPDNGVTPGDKEHTQFILDGTVKSVTLSNADAAEANTDGGLVGGALKYVGSHVDLVNDDFSVEKKVNVKGNAAADSTGSPFDNGKFEAIDDNLGVARGQVFQWAIRSEINNASKLKQYDIVDDMPYQVNVNDMVIGLTINGTYTSLIKATNETTDNSYNNGGDSGHGLGYDSDLASDGKVSFALTEAGKAYFEAKGVWAEGNDENTFVKTMIRVHGTTSTYAFDAENRAVESHTNGQLTIETKEAFRNIIGDQLSYLDVTLNVQTNSAAQVGAIDNKVGLNVENDYDRVQAEDTSKTFEAGWEFKKTDSDGAALAGAGFDLAYEVTADNINQIRQQLLGTTNLGTAVSNATLDKMAEAKGVSREEVVTYLQGQAANLAIGQKVYFTHLSMDGNNQPVIEMAGMTSIAPMGDVFWTTEPTWATTHKTGSDGYFQYCGLPAGQYTLIESIVPSGYTKMADKQFSLGGETAAPGFPFLTSSIGNMLNSDDKITGDFTGNHVEIKNYEKSIFPVTGAIGLVMMILTGALAMAYALVKRNKQAKM
ncbi:prealbumin-like fold domain-containing protein [Weissella diestrammenae]|uniref:Prealbumin-like fold domain-containing protein n=1 Tax=Weissella diestrammenae TaxID=1162633 RepID=A0A7G9T3F8_9LACO|nr:prealbumin-like fold domain-containing protein [Weissella diestrammenae]MCM0582090.1 hypothetical protein [Weissella diestrammenae]QNN74633.1 prealbumin-like fold domain-containing protein [Weissella diestrammenae]